MLVTASLAAGLLTGCLPLNRTQSPDPVHASHDRSGVEKENSELQVLPGDSIKLFADKPHYRIRNEPERTVNGVLSRVAVRTGPNTREHPIRLHTEQGEWGVYSEGISQRLLEAIIDQPLRITGKWIDQSNEGAPIEVWIGEVTVPNPSVDNLDSER